MTHASNDAERDRLLGREHQLRTHLRDLETQRLRLKYFWALSLSAIPAGIWAGAFGVVAALGAVTVLIGTAAYLISGHRAEYEQQLAEIRKGHS